MTLSLRWQCAPNEPRYDAESGLRRGSTAEVAVAAPTPVVYPVRRFGCWLHRPHPELALHSHFFSKKQQEMQPSLHPCVQAFRILILPSQVVAHNPGVQDILLQFVKNKKPNPRFSPPTLSQRTVGPRPLLSNVEPVSRSLLRILR